MNKQLEKELIKLAKKYNMDYFTQCLYCREYSLESDEPNEGTSFMVTFVERKKNSIDK